MNTSKLKFKGPQELADAMLAVKKHFIYAAALSAAVNLLMLVPTIYMLQIFDRVIGSGSLSTLLMLTLIMVFSNLAWAALSGSGLTS